MSFLIWDDDNHLESISVAAYDSKGDREAKRDSAIERAWNDINEEAQDLRARAAQLDKRELALDARARQLRRTETTVRALADAAGCVTMERLLIACAVSVAVNFVLLTQILGWVMWWM